MAYVKRIEVPGGFYHVGTRGNNKRSIAEDDVDRKTFLLHLRRVARKYGWTIYAYCLMGNHYHLVIQIGEAGLSRGMCELNTAYALAYNTRHGRINHLFGKRFWSELIKDERQMLATCRYVLQNPQRAGLCEVPEGWIWSSYRATIGMAVAFTVPLAVAELLAIVGPAAKDEAIAAFRDFCEFVVPKRRARKRRVRRQPP